MVTSKEIQQSCTTFKITGFLNFVHCLIFWTAENVLETGSVLLLRSLQTFVSEHTNITSFQNPVCCSGYNTMDKIQKPNNPNPLWWTNTAYLNSTAKEASLITAHLPTGSSIHFTIRCTKMHHMLSQNIQLCFLTETK